MKNSTENLISFFLIYTRTFCTSYSEHAPILAADSKIFRGGLTHFTNKRVWNIVLLGQVHISTTIVSSVEVVPVNDKYTIYLVAHSFVVNQPATYRIILKVLNI